MEVFYAIGIVQWRIMSPHPFVLDRHRVDEPSAIIQIFGMLLFIVTIIFHFLKACYIRPGS